MPAADVVIVTGADQGYYRFMRGAIESLARTREQHRVDVVVLDLGLTPEQAQALQTELGVRVIVPQWPFEPPADIARRRDLAFAVRPYLPSVVPGYQVYMWFDGDAWVQDERFFDAYVQPARAGRLAIVNEKEPVYRFDWRVTRWNLGNMLLAFGIVNGLRMYFSPQVNAGVFALHHDSPVWSIWARRYREAVARARKMNMDQHALLAATALDRVPVEYLTGAYNWICSRARPVFDTASARFCLPRAPHEPIAVMHLAGPSKTDVYEIETVGGGHVQGQLTFGATLAR